MVFNRQGFIAAPGTPPRYVIAKALNPRTVEVSWLPPEKPNGVIQVVAISHIKNTRSFYNYGMNIFFNYVGFFPQIFVLIKIPKLFSPSTNKSYEQQIWPN